ncbi:Outer membrane protein assembly factor BamE [Alicycliphilus sp. B1]|nr:Outer membrane protein assembly factor BamE [Alicycliphilus sp. B1]
MVSVFHGDRWEYVFTLKRPGVEAQTRKLTVFFKDNVMDHVEGDEMPSESEFVASLTSKVSKPKVPQFGGHRGAAGALSQGRVRRARAFPRTCRAARRELPAAGIAAPLSVPGPPWRSPFPF